MDRFASDVLENWTPPETDTHPDDTPRAFDDDGAPLGLSCPLRPAERITSVQARGFTRLREQVKVAGINAIGVENPLEYGAIEGAGGTHWVPRSSAWSVEPSRIRALSSKGRAWLKATHARLATYTLPGETGQRTAPLATAYRAALCVSKGNKGDDALTRYRNDSRAWRGVCVATGETVLTLRMPRTDAESVVEAYGIAGRPLVLRPA